MSDKKQLNVRLTDEDLANVELLKQHEVSLAEVIRDALRLHVLRFATALHERLGVEIPESDYTKITSVAGCVDYLKRHLPA